MCDNIYDCNGIFDDRAYSYVATCHGMIRGFRDGNCNEEIYGFRNFCERNYDEEEEEVIRDEVYIDEDEMIILLCHPYKFNVVKEYDDIYIEIRSCLDELKMTIDAKKIIHKLSAPLEDEEWEKLKIKKLGRLCFISTLLIRLVFSIIQQRAN